MKKYILLAEDDRFLRRACETKLKQQGFEYIFLDSTTSGVFDQTLADYLVQKQNLTSIAMITNNGAYGKGEHDSFLTELTKLGVKPTIDKIVTPDQKDFTSVLTEIRGTNPKVLFVGAEEVQESAAPPQVTSLKWVKSAT